MSYLRLRFLARYGLVLESERASSPVHAQPVGWNRFGGSPAWSISGPSWVQRRLQPDETDARKVSAHDGAMIGENVNVHIKAFVSLY